MSVKFFEGVEPRVRQSILRDYFEARCIECRKHGAPNPRIPRGIFVVEHGKLLMRVPITRGAHRDVTDYVELIVLEAGDFFGEIRGLLRGYGDRSSAESVVVEAPLRVRRLRNGPSDDPAPTLSELFAKYPAVGVNMLTEMARRLAATGRFIQSSIEDRIRVELVRVSQGKPGEIIATSASKLGRTIRASGQGVMDALRDMEESGMIKVGLRRNRGIDICIIDHEELARGLLIPK